MTGELGGVPQIPLTPLPYKEGDGGWLIAIGNGMNMNKEDNHEKVAIA